jgi:uncharacterized protein (TIGR03067 family)
MRAKLLLVVAAGLLAVPAVADDATKDRIEGTWVVVSCLKNGKAQDDIKGDKVTFKDSTVTVQSKKKEEKAAYKVDTSKKPSTIDITPEGGKGTVLAIYKIEGDVLKLCFVEKEGAGRPTEFAAKEGTDAMLIELKREKKN